MELPFAIPPWIPPWLVTTVLAVGLLFALAFLLMPFAVFGVKGRLDNLEAQLEELHGEIRALVLRLPEMRNGPPIPPTGLDREPLSQPIRSPAKAIASQASARVEPKLP